MPLTYVAGTAFTVTVAVTPPAGTFSQAIEDKPPAGWTVSSVSNSGGFDAVNGKVKWGPFFDSDARTLTYVLTPPAGTTGSGAFVGTASFDGGSLTISGSSSIAAGGLPEPVASASWSPDYAGPAEIASGSRPAAPRPANRPAANMHVAAAYSAVEPDRAVWRRERGPVAKARAARIPIAVA